MNRKSAISILEPIAQLQQRDAPIAAAAVERALEKAVLNQRHAEELKRSSAELMAWNYRETLPQLATPAAA